MTTWINWEEVSTGGGCVAYVQQVGNVNVWITCSENECRLPQPGDLVDVGFTRKDTGEPIELRAAEQDVAVSAEEAAALIARTLRQLQ